MATGHIGHPNSVSKTGMYTQGLWFPGLEPSPFKSKSESIQHVGRALEILVIVILCNLTTPLPLKKKSDYAVAKYVSRGPDILGFLKLFLS